MRNNQSERIRAVMGSTDLSRRSFLGLSAASVAALAGAGALASCSNNSNGGASGKNQVLVATSGPQDSVTQYTYEAFEQETGITVIPVLGSATKVQAMVKAGNVVLDVAPLSQDAELALAEMDALEKLDHGKFERTDLNDINPVTDYTAGWASFATALVYNTDKFSASEMSDWAAAWNVEQFPGRRTLQSASLIQPDLEFALLADGVSMDQLYPLDLDRAFESIKRIEDSILKYYISGAENGQLFSAGQVDVGSAFTNRIWPLIDGGAPLAVQWNGHARFWDALGILKDAPNKENAYKFLDFALQAKVQADSLIPLGLAPSHKAASEGLDAKAVERLPTATENRDKGFDVDGAWWKENQELVLKTWQAKIG